MKTVFIDENIPYLAEILSAEYNTKMFYGRDLIKQDLIDNDCFALFTRSTTNVNEHLLEGTNVKFVATNTSGIDHIDTQYLKDNNIYFASALGANANSVAEYVVFGALFYAVNKSLKLRNMTIGIIGFGNIGSKVAYYANTAGMKVLVNDPPLKELGNSFPDNVSYCDLDYLLENSDIITNHVPLTTTGKYPTYNLINADNINKIKQIALIVHSSRGGVINEDALCKFLKSREGVELVIDVYEKEPNINEYLVQRSLISTPHIAGYSANGKINGINMILSHFEEFTGKKFSREILDVIPMTTPMCIDYDKEDIYRRVSESRMLLEDSLKFHDLLNLTGPDRQEAFDRQRREYPKRFEFLSLENTLRLSK